MKWKWVACNAERQCVCCSRWNNAGDQSRRPFAHFMRAVVWSYFGTRDFGANPQIDESSVSRHIDQIPSSFISVGMPGKQIRRARLSREGRGRGRPRHRNHALAQIRQLTR
jgi:hypothetical protein